MKLKNKKTGEIKDTDKGILFGSKTPLQKAFEDYILFFSDKEKE